MFRGITKTKWFFVSIYILFSVVCVFFMEGFHHAVFVGCGVGQRVHFHRSAQVAHFEMGVYFGGQDGFVAEEFLHGPDVGAALQQVSRERVAQGMGADGFGDACGCGAFADDGEDHHAGQFPAVLVEEQDVGRVCRHGHRAPLVEVVPYLTERGVGDGDEPLFVPFAGDAHDPFFREDVVQPQVHQFAHAQAAAVKHFEDGPVAVSERGAQVDAVDHPADLFVGEGVGQFAGDFGRFDQFGGRRFDTVAVEQEGEEAPHAAQGTGLGGVAGAAVVNAGHERFYVGRDDGGGFFRGAVFEDEGAEPVHVAQVGFDAVGGQAAFETEVIPVVVDGLSPGVFCRLIAHFPFVCRSA